MLTNQKNGHSYATIVRILPLTNQCSKSVQLVTGILRPFCGHSTTKLLPLFCHSECQIFEKTFVKCFLCHTKTTFFPQFFHRMAKLCRKNYPWPGGGSYFRHILRPRTVWRVAKFLNSAIVSFADKRRPLNDHQAHSVTA